MNNIILTVMRYLDNPESVSEAEHNSNVAYAASTDYGDDAFTASSITAAAAHAAAVAAAADRCHNANGWVEEYFIRSGEDKGVYYEAVNNYTPIKSIKPIKSIYAKEMRESGILPLVGSDVLAGPDNAVMTVISVSHELGGAVTMMSVGQDFAMTITDEIKKRRLSPLGSIEEKLKGQLIGDGMTQEAAEAFVGRVIAGDYAGLKWSGK